AFAWSILGSYRAMKMQLRYPVWPIVWITFLGFTIFYNLGFQLTGFDLQSLPQNRFDPWFRQENMLDYKLAFSTFTLALLLYFNLISRPIDIVKYRKLFVALSKLRFSQAFQYVPIWFFTYITFTGLIVYFSLKVPHVIN